ncbi:UbiA family prenyltransferase [Lentzea sp. NPDC092896]|uniref:UbiA family prenyltransferase n=1 Tax=Lentzea sp. NPDC092896 TaxID=3364127 RepID=UPI003815C8FD
MTTWWRFSLQRYPPAKYVFYVFLLVAAVLTTLAPLRAGSGPGPVEVACGWAGAFTLLYFFRVVDEIKDLPYDREFSPARPLVTGDVTTADIRTYGTGSAVAALAFSAVAGLGPLIVAAGAMSYSLLLFLAERKSARFADSMWGNIVVTIQLKTILVLYVVAVGGGGEVLPTGLLVVSFLFGYLHWEIARKTMRREFERRGEKLYSTAAGWRGGASVALVLLVVACGLQAVVALVWDDAGLETLLLALPLPITAWGLAKLARSREKRYAPGNPALLAYVVFLAACTLRTLP